MELCQYWRVYSFLIRLLKFSKSGQQKLTVFSLKGATAFYCAVAGDFQSSVVETVRLNGRSVRSLLKYSLLETLGSSF